MRDGALLAVACAAMAAAASRPALRAAPSPDDAAHPVGAAACASCHARVHADWTAGRHSRMVQPATPAAVRGDFAAREVRLRGLSYRLRRDGEAFFVTESYLTGSPVERRVDYTLGNRRVQHYLSRLEDGRIVVLPPSWDVQRREWFHNLDIVDPEESGGVRVQVWNAHCYGCHVSQQEKGYDPARRTYETRWMDFGTGCERCHGPGSRHVAARRAGWSPVPGEVVRPLDLPADRQTMVCAQCHSLRDIVSGRYVAGSDYFDHYMPILEYAQKQGPDPAWWVDGRPRRFSNDALGFWQSACHLEGGATCLSCHESAHLPDVDGARAPRAGGDASCLGCHPAVARDVPAHTRHRAGSAGSSCVECHMPPEVFSLRRSAMRDHTISIPAPTATARHGVPNACGTCHEGRSARWAEEALRRLWPAARASRALTRADAFAGGRAARPAALAGLLALAGDASEPFLVRANAVGHLRSYAAPSAIAAAERALGDAHPLVRAVAAFTLAEQRAGSRPAVRAAISDVSRIVRVAAAFALVSGGVTRLPGPEGAALGRAKREHAERAALLADDARTQLELGKFHLLDRDADAAAAALEAARRLDPALPGSAYLLGLARIAQGRSAEGRALLAAVPRTDPYHRAAAGILDKLE